MGREDGQRRTGLVRPEQVGDRMSPPRISIAMSTSSRKPIANQRCNGILCDTSKRRLQRTLHKLGWKSKNYYLVQYEWSFIATEKTFPGV